MAMIVAPTASLAASRFVPPRWLATAERSLLVRTFGGSKPVRTHYISYPKKIAVVFEFSHVVICGRAVHLPPNRSREARSSASASTDAHINSAARQTDGQCDSAKSAETPSHQRTSVFFAE